RPPLPPSGRDRHPAVHHGRLRDPRRPSGHDPQARRHEPGAGEHRPGRELPRRASRRSLSRRARTAEAAPLSGPIPSASRAARGSGRDRMLHAAATASQRGARTVIACRSALVRERISGRRRAWPEAAETERPGGGRTTNAAAGTTDTEAEITAVDATE